MKQNAPPGVVEFDSDQEGAAILGGDAGAIIQYSGNALKSDDPTQTKVAGKLDFGVVPKQEKAIAQLGIFIAGVPKSAPNKANAIEFLKWYTSPDTQAKLAEAGSIPVTRSGFARRQARQPADPGRAQATRRRRLAASAHAGLGEGRGTPRHRAQQGAAGRFRRRRGARRRRAAQVTDYLTQAGYYK